MAPNHPGPAAWTSAAALTPNAEVLLAPAGFGSARLSRRSRCSGMLLVRRRVYVRLFSANILSLAALMVWIYRWARLLLTFRSEQLMAEVGPPEACS